MGCEFANSLFSPFGKKVKGGLDERKKKKEKREKEGGRVVGEKGRETEHDRFDWLVLFVVVVVT